MKRPAAALAPEAELGTGGDNDKTGKLVRSDTSSWRWQVELEEGLGTKALKSANFKPRTRTSANAKWDLESRCASSRRFNHVFLLCERARGPPLSPARPVRMI